MKTKKEKFYGILILLITLLILGVIIAAVVMNRKEPEKVTESTAVSEDKAKKEVVIKVPEVIDSPEVKEWPELKVSAVLAGGTRGGALVNGAVVSVGEATADGPVLKSVSKQAAVFEWDGETRTFFVNAKPEK